MRQRQEPKEWGKGVVPALEWKKGSMTPSRGRRLRRGPYSLWTIVYLGVSLLWISCGKMEEMGAAPPDLAFEMQRTMDPATGEVPSELRFKALGATEWAGTVGKRERVYPNSWQRVDDRFASLAVTQVVHDPTDPMVFYFCTGEGFFNADAARGAGVWKSEDGGENWQQLASTANDTFYYCQDMIVHPVTRDVYVSTRARGVMRSEDGGNSWESVLHAGNGSSTNRAVDLELTGDDAILASFGHFSSDGIYYSTSGDPGSWERRMNGITNATYRIELTASPSSPEVYYAVAEGTNRRVEGVYRTDDRGLNWQRLADPGGNDSLANAQAWYDLIIKVDPNDPDVVVAGGLNLWRSRDGGQTWQQLAEGDRRKRSALQYVHVDQHEIVFQGSDTVYFTNDGGIYRCVEFTADSPRIHAVNENYNVTQFYSVAQSAEAGKQLVMGGTQDNGTSRSSAASISDFVQVSWADGSFCAVDHQDDRYLYSTTQYKRIFRYNGQQLDTLTNPDLPQNATLFINPMIMDANDPQTLFQASNMGVWRLKGARTAGPQDWTRTTRQIGGITALATSTSLENLLLIGRSVDGQPYRLDNAHISDENALPVRMDRNGQLPSQGYLNCIFIDPKDADHVLLAYTNYNFPSVWETRNALDEDPDWVNVEGDLPNLPVRWIALHPETPGVCYIATEMGVYYTDSLNGAQTRWRRTDPGLPNVRVDMIEFRTSDGRMVAATHGRGIFEGELDGNDVRWTERGPRNVGGRTRTLMIDPNRGNGKTLWAGSVSGGLWRVENIDSVDVYYELPDEPQAVGLYPNPAMDRVWVVPARDASFKLDIYSPHGQRIASVQVETARYQFDVSGLANGTYLVSVTQGEDRQVYKLLVQH